MLESIAKIQVSSNDAANLTSLTNLDAATYYVMALQAAYPDAMIDIVSARQLVSAQLADGSPVDDQRISEMREIIGLTWERLAIDYPQSDMQEEEDADEAALQATYAALDIASVHDIYKSYPEHGRYGILGRRANGWMLILYPTYGTGELTIRESVPSLEMGRFLMRALATRPQDDVS